MAILSRSWRSNLALLLACALPLWIGMHAVHAAPPAPVVRRFILPARMDGPPVIAGNTVAWITRPGTCHIHAAPSTCNLPSYLHLADLTHFRPRTIVRFAATVSNVSLRLSQQYLVWMSTRYPAPGWWVWSRDLRTGRQTLLDSSQMEGGPAAPAYPGLSLQGDTLAWTRNDCLQGCILPGSSSITIMNLGTGVKHTIAVHHGRCWILSTPTLTTRTLIWTEQPHSDITGCGGDTAVPVMRLDRATGTTRQMTIKPPPGKIVSDFTGNDRYLAWTQETLHTNHGSRVLLMDTRTGRVVPITAAGADRPAMNGNILVWYGQYSSTIGALDLHTWRYYVLDRNHDQADISTGPSFLGPPWGKRVVWDGFRFRDTGGPSRDFLTVADVP